MTTVFQPQYQLAVNYNNAAGLAVIEGVLPSGDTRRFAPFRGFGAENPGEIKVREDGLHYHSGFPSTAWFFEWMSAKQYQYISDTFCGGGTAGKVTVRTTLKDNDSWANYNSILYLRKRNELTWNMGGWDAVTIALTRLVAL